ncbi:MAG: ABC transporter permease [Actinomycetales bacterium]
MSTATLDSRQDAPSARPVVADKVRRRVTAGVIVVLVGLVDIFLLGLSARSGAAKFALSSATADIHLPVLSLPPRATAIVIGVITVALGVWRAARPVGVRWRRVIVSFAIVGLVVTFLCWADSSEPGSQPTPLELPGLLNLTLLAAVPLILGALGGVLCERSGVINVAIEGQMLTGAFAGALFGSLSHHLGVGLVGALVAGALIGALLAVFAIRYLVNQVVLGVVLNLFALGLTGFIYDALMQPNADTYNSPSVFSPIAIPVLSDIPLIGAIFFNVNIIVYLTYLLVIAVHVGLFHTRWGLRTRSVGEHPKAADTVGINVIRTRYVNVIGAGLVAGLAGAYLTLGDVGSFTKDMSSGRGFIALAAVIFGRWSPLGAVSAALLFGFADVLQGFLSFIGTPVAIPSAFLAMLPYVATILAVAGFVGRVRAPAADGEPYTS